MEREAVRPSSLLFTASALAFLGVCACLLSFLLHLSDDGDDMLGALVPGQVGASQQCCSLQSKGVGLLCKVDYFRRYLDLRIRIDDVVGESAKLSNGQPMRHSAIFSLPAISTERLLAVVTRRPASLSVALVQVRYFVPTRGGGASVVAPAADMVVKEEEQGRDPFTVAAKTTAYRRPPPSFPARVR